MNFWKLHEDVAFGKSGGKIIWQPRISCWIDDKMYEIGKLPAPYTGLSKPEIYRKLGCSARIYEYNGCFEKVYDKSIKPHYEKLSELETKLTIETPKGTLTQVNKANTSNNGIMPKKWLVETKEDLEIMAYIEENTDWRWNQEHFDKTKEIWKNLGAPTVFLERTSIQKLFIDLMGIESAIYATFDYEDTLLAYFDSLHRSHERLIKVVNKSPINIINFGDNLHAGTLPPDMFEKYLLPYYQKRCELLKDGGKFTCAHWDGDTKSLLPYAKHTMLDGIEAITPKPQGDVNLKEVKKHLGDMFLLDGIAAILFNQDYTVKELVDQTKLVIDLFAPNLILGISDEISSTGDIERIKIINEIVDDYNSKQ